MSSQNGIYSNVYLFEILMNLLMCYILPDFDNFLICYRNQHFEQFYSIHITVNIICLTRFSTFRAM